MAATLRQHSDGYRAVPLPPRSGGVRGRPVGPATGSARSGRRSAQNRIDPSGEFQVEPGSGAGAAAPPRTARGGRHPVPVGGRFVHQAGLGHVLRARSRRPTRSRGGTSPRALRDDAVAPIKGRRSRNRVPNRTAVSPGSAQPGSSTRTVHEVRQSSPSTAQIAVSRTCSSSRPPQAPTGPRSRRRSRCTPPPSPGRDRGGSGRQPGRRAPPARGGSRVCCELEATSPGRSAIAAPPLRVGGRVCSTARRRDPPADTAPRMTAAPASLRLAAARSPGSPGP